MSRARHIDASKVDLADRGEAEKSRGSSGCQSRKSNVTIAFAMEDLYGYRKNLSGDLPPGVTSFVSYKPGLDGQLEPQVVYRKGDETWIRLQSACFSPAL